MLFSAVKIFYNRLSFDKVKADYRRNSRGGYFFDPSGGLGGVCHNTLR